MEIVKLHCLGNDYLVVGEEAQQYSLPALAEALCRQRQGAGGDGLIVLSPGPPGRRRMELYNSRGMRVEPGPSALRCAGNFLGAGSWELDTGTRRQRVDVREKDTILWYPPPVFVGEYQIGCDHHGHLVNLFQRYFVTFVHQLRDLNLQIHGQALDRYFSGIDIVFTRDGEAIEARIWRQGRGEIPGCGAGACAAAATLLRLGKWREPMEITMAGGRAVMTLDRQGRFVQQVAVERVLEAQVNETLLWACKE
jgi:diaminopimelate epimerase